MDGIQEKHLLVSRVCYAAAAGKKAARKTEKNPAIRCKARRRKPELTAGRKRYIIKGVKEILTSSKKIEEAKVILLEKKLGT